MTQIGISDHVAAHLVSAAEQRGCAPEDLASMLIEDALRLENDFALTGSQKSRILESIEQAERGEVVDGEMVMRRFYRVLHEIAAK